MVAAVQQTVGAALHGEAGLLQKIADSGRVVDGFTDVFFKLLRAVFKDAGDTG